jgi:dipeptidyl aminopeptidase/acylaminoacyl peptidase
LHHINYFNLFQGSPYPEDVTNGVDTIVQFAIHRLNFKPENIFMFGWSIGGYAVTWAAMNYPDIKGVVSFTI